MPFFKFSETELREISKKYIETLEFWLRRVIHEEFFKEYGDKYWEYADEKGVFLIRKDIREGVSSRFNGNNERFPRWIDATFFENQIDIICKKDVYDKFFSKHFSLYFINNEDVRRVLSRLIDPRNRLAHANSISIRQAEQIVCYSNDIIDSIKSSYNIMNKQKQFNVPSIIHYSDSLGNARSVEDHATRKMWTIDLRSNPFRVGDRIKFSIRMDSSFERSEYDIQWNVRMSEILGDSEEVEVDFVEQFVSELVVFRARIISKKSWHRFGNHDDEISIACTVLPPLD